MSSIAAVLQNIDTYRDLVPLYYSRSTGRFIVAQVQRNNGGAFILDADGREIAFHRTKREALAFINA